MKPHILPEIDPSLIPATPPYKPAKAEPLNMHGFAALEAEALRLRKEYNGFVDSNTAILEHILLMLTTLDERLQVSESIMHKNPHDWPEGYLEAEKEYTIKELEEFYLDPDNEEKRKAVLEKREEFKNHWYHKTNSVT